MVVRIILYPQIHVMYRTQDGPMHATDDSTDSTRLTGFRLATRIDHRSEAAILQF